MTSMPGPSPTAQSYVQVPHTLLDSGVGASVLLTYMAIRRVAWKVGDVHKLGQDAIVELTGTNRRTVSRHLAILEQVGAIEVERKGARNPDHIRVCAHGDIQELGDGTPESHHSSMCKDTGVPSQRGVMGHPEQGDGTPVSHTMGHQSPIRREEDFSQESEEEEVLEQHSHLSVANDGTAPAGGVPGGKGPGVAAGAATTPDPYVHTEEEVWLRVSGHELVLGEKFRAHPEAHAFRAAVATLQDHTRWSIEAIAHQAEVAHKFSGGDFAQIAAHMRAVAESERKAS